MSELCLALNLFICGAIVTSVYSDFKHDQPVFTEVQLAILLVMQITFFIIPLAL